MKKDMILHTIARRMMLLFLMVTLGAGVSWGEGEITSLDDITDPTGTYTLSSSFSTSGTAKDVNNVEIGTSTNPFKGTIDGQLVTIIGTWDKPLFDYVKDATIKNVIIGTTSISGNSGNTGAIAGNAQGVSRIYNCGILDGSVGGTAYTGGLVGFLDGTARVINCYSYANITGGTTKGGIVGYNNYASKSGDIRTMVMNCMFYGTGSGIYPIYGGMEISNNDNNKLNNYNYFCYENLPTANIIKINNVQQYNRALAAEERYLVRFEFYRHLLNSTRELAASYVDPNPITIRVNNKDHKRYHVDLMAKWVLDKDIAPYPILKVQDTYPSVVNYEDAPTLGTLSVTINQASNAPTGATVSGTSLPIYDKNLERFHFNYRTVRLPYYNEVGTKNYTGGMVVTGWEITGMSGSGSTLPTKGTFTTADEWGGYNFADRSTYAKDLYAENGGRVFSQGAYFDVPDGVTSITMKPHWAKAVYLSDPYYDKYGYAKGDVTDFGLRYDNKSTYEFEDGVSRKVYTSFSDAIGDTNLDGSTVYDNAVVLVGNYHHSNGNTEISSGSKAFTIMSIDLNNDNEPDYSLIYRSGKQNKLSPIRFDFINVPGAAMAHKTASNTNMGIPGNAKLAGWFEVTNTALIHYSQFEYDSENKTGSDPVILLGGVFEQIVSTNGGEGCLANKTTKYIHVGSNVWFKIFNNGCHLDKTQTETPHVPISVTGGDYEKFYLSGYFQPNAKQITDDAECYISGGRFGEVAGAGHEPINGNVTWMIHQADITDFYGGGINEEKRIKGNITVTIKDSRVGTYCGGPKFGNMNPDTELITNATGCTFGSYYGAGFGGTSLYRYLWNVANNGGHNCFNLVNYEWNGTSWVGHTTNGYTSSTRGKYVNGRGILVSYDYEHFEGSSTNTVARLYMLYASLSLAQTKDVMSNLTGCTITGNFYGGGKLGSVDGSITSTLNNCTVSGNVFGAGYSGAPPSVEIFKADDPNTGGGFKRILVGENEYVLKIPNYNTNTGVFEKGEFPDAVTYTWSSKGSVTNNSQTGSLVDDSEGHWIHTDVSLSGLGTVTKNATLTITTTEDGVSTIGTVGDNTTGNVYGGGDDSAVNGNTIVKLSGHTNVLGNVYGGGNKGLVEGSAEVKIENLSSTP